MTTTDGDFNLRYYRSQRRIEALVKSAKILHLRWASAMTISASHDGRDC
ncbi:hypothetical protein KCP78_10955 [Salmonella enterica subsp. enterica]|nr:hypothetical protein KCP78_10955 [Salmonella enterica subsp. enterica]